MDLIKKKMKKKKSSMDNQIELIDENLLKISKLLMLYYGEAGASLVSKLIRNESSFLDFS